MAATIEVRAELIDGISSSLKKIEKNVAKSMGNVEKHAAKATKGTGRLTGSVTTLGGAWGLIAGVAGGLLVRSFLNAGSEVEDLTTQFETLLGSTSAAQQRMQELSRFATRTPFELKGIADASRILETLTQGALSTKKGLTLVGDVAAVTGEDFSGLAVHVGRAYDGLRSNRPVGEAMARLQELGVVSGKVRGQIERLTKQVRGKEAWEILEESLGRMSGGMAKLSKNVTGLASTFRDQLKGAMRDILVGGLWGDTKKGMQGLVDTMEKWLESGVFLRIGKGITAFVKLAKVSMVNLPKFVLMGLTKVIGAITWWYGFLLEKINWLVDKIPDKLFPDTWAQGLKDAEAMLKTTTKTMGFMTDDLRKETEDNAQKAQKALADLVGAFLGVQTGGGVPPGGGPPKPKPKPTGDDDKIPDIPDASAVAAQLAAIQEIRREFFKIGKNQRDRDIADLEVWYAGQAETIGNNEEAQVQLYQVFLERRAEMKEEWRMKEEEEDQAHWETEIANFEQFTGSIINTASMLTQTRSNLIEKERKAEVRAIKSSQRTAKEKEKLIEETNKKAEEEQKKAGNVRKGVAIVEAIINTALGVSSALTMSPPPLGIAMAIIVGAMGAAQIALIASQSFAQGGVVKGPTTGDQNLVRANGGEMFLTFQQQARLLSLADGQLSGRGTNVNAPITLNIGTVDADNREDLVEDLKEMVSDLVYAGQTP